jgi:hypothetical protein
MYHLQMLATSDERIIIKISAKKLTRSLASLFASPMLQRSHFGCAGDAQK